ncbi:MAG: trehalose-phosphatase [Alphaproteobacteria bacterium]|nr:trehalose-phosphatase [Alphaproteobacteria bacterium]
MVVSNREGMDDIVQDSCDKAYFIDFDGTMVDLTVDPKAVDVPDALIRNLKTLEARDDCSFAIVTGREIDLLDKFLEGVKTTAVGCHGAECRLGKDEAIESLTAPLPKAVVEAVHEVGDRHDALCEDKIYGASLHLPPVRAEENIKTEIQNALGEKKENYLVRKIGRTYELMKKGISKGTGIRYLMRRSEFKGKTPVYIGDDATTDASLAIVTDLGGTLVSVRRPDAAGDKQTTIEPKDVRTLIAALAAR